MLRTKVYSVWGFLTHSVLIRSLHQCVTSPPCSLQRLVAVVRYKIDILPRNQFK